MGDPLCLGMFLGGGGRGVQKRGDSFLTGMSKKRRAEKMEKSSEKESLPCLLTLKIRTKIDNLSERRG